MYIYMYVAVQPVPQMLCHYKSMSKPTVFMMLHAYSNFIQAHCYVAEEGSRAEMHYVHEVLFSCYMYVNLLK